MHTELSLPTPAGATPYARPGRSAAPVAGVASRAIRLARSNFVVIAGGWLVYLALRRGADLTPGTIAGWPARPAGGLVMGMLFEGWLDSLLPAGFARLAEFGAVATIAGLFYLGLRAFAYASGWTRAEPEEWVAYVALNAIGTGVILHVAVGRRWPFMPTADTGGSRE